MLNKTFKTKSIKRSNNDTRIRIAIMYPLWLFTALSILYVILTFRFTTCIDRHKNICRGSSFLFNYITLFYLFCANLKIRDIIDDYVPLIMPGFAVKMVQIAIYLFVFHVQKIYYLHLIILLFFELMLTMFVSFDGNNMKYTREKDVTEESGVKSE